MNTFKQNLSAMWGHISTYVALGASSGAAVWLNLDAASQQQIIAAVPGLKVGAPLVTIVAFVIAKGIPQKPRDPTPQQSADVPEPAEGSRQSATGGVQTAFDDLEARQRDFQARSRPEDPNR